MHVLLDACMPLPNTVNCEHNPKHYCSFIQTDIEISREEDFARILQMEEEFIQQMCEELIRVKPDLIITEKGISGKCDQLSGCKIFSGAWGVCHLPDFFHFRPGPALPDESQHYCYSPGKEN